MAASPIPPVSDPITASATTENEMLRIHAVALELVRDVVPLLREIERSDPDLARQGRRAVMSVPLNISEGSDQAGKRRTHHYRIALGSAREVQDHPEVIKAYLGG